MASTPRAPKQWVLQKNETVNSFESWKQNLLFTLKLEPSLAPFLAEGAVWEPDSEEKACRGSLLMQIPSQKAVALLLSKS